MKRLTLLRHAKSGTDDMVLRDFDRTLNGKGRRAARAVGEHLRKEGLAFDHAIASPAARVEQTVAAVGEALGRSLDPVWDRRLYLAAPETLLDVIHETPDAFDSLLIVGHNPGLEELVLMLVPGGAGDARDRVEEKYPTASLAEILFDDAASWDQVRPGQGRLARFVRPRDLDPALGPDAAG